MVLLLCSSSVPPELLPYFALSIESEIIDGFWCSRCINDHFNLPDMIGSFASGATNSLVAKNGIKRIIPLLWIKSSPVERFWCLRCLNHRIDLPDMMRLFASGATNSLVAKNETRKISQLFEELQGSNLDRFWCSRCQNKYINLPDMVGSFASGTTTSIVPKNWTINDLSCLKSYKAQIWFIS